MAGELLRTALRVLSCFTDTPLQQPDPADVEWLRKSVCGEEINLDADVLAAYIIQRVLNRHKAKGAGG
jgi:hypothetical protein